jgi:hypothetical protein
MRQVNDRSLSDIGMRRSEIRSMAYALGYDPFRKDGRSEDHQPTT